MDAPDGMGIANARGASCEQLADQIGDYGSRMRSEDSTDAERAPKVGELFQVFCVWQRNSREGYWQQNGDKIIDSKREKRNDAIRTTEEKFLCFSVYFGLIRSSVLPLCSQSIF